MSEETETKTEAVQDVRGGKPSASSIFRLMECPGSWQAEQLAGPEVGPNPAAEMGTRLHKHMEEGTFPEDPEEREAVEWCREAEAELVARFIGADAQCVRERRLWDKTGKFSGQEDVVYSNAVAALVIDYKFGRVPVAPAESNYQMAALAVLVAQELPDVQEVYVAILQPYVSRQVPRVVRYTRAAAESAHDALCGGIAAAQAPGAPLRPGEHQCRYCRAQATCPASARLATCDAVVRWEALSPEQRVELYRRAKMARKLADKVEAQVRADLEAEVELPGLTLGDGRASFTVTDAQGAFAVLAEELGLTAQEYVRCCKVSITQLDAAVHARLKERDPKQTTKASKEALRAMLAGYGEVKVTAGTIKEMELLG